MSSRATQSRADRPECASVRALLFDYCDGELGIEQRDQVDEHVVRCRECGTVLSQVELDHIRLKNVLVPMEPPAGFTHAVMDRVRDVVASTEPQEPSRDFTRRVMDRVREEAGAPVPERGTHLRRVAFFAAAAVVLVSAFLGVWLARPAPQGPKPDWFVSRARGVPGLEAGQALGAGKVLAWDGGAVELDARCNDEGACRFQLTLRGMTRGEIAGRGRLRLDRGDLRLATLDGERPEGREPAVFVVDLPDGQSLLASGGDHSIAVHPVELDGGALLPAGLSRVVVHVWSGSLRLRSAEGSATVPAGHLAVIEPLQPLRVAAFPVPGIEPVNPRVPDPNARGELAAGELRTVRGRIRGPDYRPVPGALVRLQTEEGAQEAVAGADGSYSFRFRRSRAAAGAQQPYLAVTASGRADLAPVEYRPFRSSAAGETLTVDVELGAARRFRGRVLASGAAVAGARVRALRFDAFFRTGRLLADTMVTSDAEGRFELAGWTRERRGEMTALLIESGEKTLHAVYGLERGTAGTELAVHLPATTQVELRVQSDKTRRLWVERRPSGPLAAFYREFDGRQLAPGTKALRLHVRSTGVVRWWEDLGTGKPVRGHVATIGSGGGTGGVALLAVAPATVELPPVSADGAPVAELPGVRPFGRFGPSSTVDGDRPDGAKLAIANLRLTAEREGTPVAQAMVYVRIGDELPWFAGWSDVEGRIELGRLPVATPIHAICVEARPANGVGSVRFTLDRDTDLPVTIAPSRSLTGKLAAAKDATDRLAEFVLVDGPFRDYRGTAVVDPDGSVHLPDVPPGSVRVRVGDRYRDVEANDGSALPDASEWKTGR